MRGRKQSERAYPEGVEEVKADLEREVSAVERGGEAAGPVVGFDHGVGEAGSQEIARVREGVRRGGARRGDGQSQAVEAERCGDRGGLRVEAAALERRWRRARSRGSVNS